MEIDYSAQAEAHRVFVAEGLRRQVDASERSALRMDQVAKSVDTIKTLMIVWFILSLLGAAVFVVAASGR